MGGAPTACSTEYKPHRDGDSLPAHPFGCPLSYSKKASVLEEKGRFLVYSTHLGPPSPTPSVTEDPSLSPCRGSPNSPCLPDQTFSNPVPPAFPGLASSSSGLGTQRHSLMPLVLVFPVPSKS